MGFWIVQIQIVLQTPVCMESVCTDGFDNDNGDQFDGL